MMKKNRRVCEIALVFLAAGWAMIGAPVSLGQTAPDAPGQGTPKADGTNATTGGNSGIKESTVKKEEHRFWDKENGWLFAGVGAARTLDYFSTLNMRRRGRQEILLTNAVVDNHAAFAAIEASATGASIGAAYLFHRFGHHKLERWTSFVHIGLATTGAVRNYCLKTAHLTTTPCSPSS